MCHSLTEKLVFPQPQEIDRGDVPPNRTWTLELQALSFFNQSRSPVPAPVAHAIPDVLFQKHGLGPVNAGADQVVVDGQFDKALVGQWPFCPLSSFFL